MSQYENALSIQLQEHLIRLAHQQTFVFPFYLTLPLLSLIFLSLISELKYFLRK